MYYWHSFKLKNMKLTLKLTALLLLFYSCSDKEDDFENDYVTLKDSYYKMTSFISTQSIIDINNDGIINSDVFLELSHYSTVYGLNKKVKKKQTLFSFYIPHQYIFPDGLVDFERNGFTILLDNDVHFVENILIDNENEVKYFSKISETKYRLILAKKYYDFRSSQYTYNEFEINYELAD